MYPSGPDAVLQCWEESIGGRRAWGAGRDGESMVAGSRSRDGRTTRRQTRWTRWGLGGSGVLVMFRRGDGDGDGKRSRKVNCSQLGPGLAGWFVGFGFGSSTPKDKKTGQSVADPGSARSAVPSARPQAPQQGGAKQEGGGPGLVQHSIAVRAVHQLKRRDPLSIQPLSQRTRSRFSLALGTPASCNARNISSI